MPDADVADDAPAPTSTSTTSIETTSSSSSTPVEPSTTESTSTTTDAASTTAVSEEAAPTPEPDEPASSTTTSAQASTTSTTTVAASTTTSSSSSTTSTEAPTAFTSRILEIDDSIAARMSASWRPGCPVELADLRLLELAHWNFDERVSIGELVVHADHADELVGVFGRLFEIRFPIERMELVDVYDGDDDRSMAANNTSAFNCREVAWKPGVWSNHAFGAAIDINPLINPYVAGPNIFPPEGEPFADRSVRATGGLYPGDAAVEAFYAIGWGWGGTWSGAKDWQHFSASGN